MRFLILPLFFTILFSILSFNLYRLQIDEGFYYFGKIEARNGKPELRRGQIFFKDTRSGGDIRAALNSDYPIVYAVPKEIKDAKKTAGDIAGILKINEAKLAVMLDNPLSMFRLLIDRADKEMIDQVKKAKIQGIYTGFAQDRSYPLECLASQVLGFVGINKDSSDPIGLYGTEKFFDYKLSLGDDVYLSIDRNLQIESERVLSGLVKKFNGTGGSIVIQEPKTGKILAIAGKPDFNPNSYSSSPIKNFLNPAVQYVYEPGSVFKPLTMAAGIDSGAFTPDTTFMDKGNVTLNGKTILNWDKKANGKITMIEVIEGSVNTGAVFAEQKIGHKTFTAYVKRFGLGENTGIDLPDEVSGSINNLGRKEARDIDFATASFGQGVSVTPIQMISAFSALANGGVLMRPFVTEGTNPTIVRRVVSKETATKVTGMMESAVEKAKIAAIQHFRIAGKTGTAFIPKGGKYSEELIQTFVGFFPASDPKVTILIKLDKPNAPLAGITVVPAFHELAAFVINYYNVSPDMPFDSIHQSNPKTQP